jgi:hypothetical protein
MSATRIAFLFHEQSAKKEAEESEKKWAIRGKIK